MKTKKVVIFKVNKNKDIWNWWHACNNPYLDVDWSQRIPIEIRKEIVGKTQEQATKFLKKYLKENYYSNEKFLAPQKDIASFWEDVEGEVIKRTEKITRKPFWPKKIICYFTSFPRGRYEFDIQNNTAHMFMDPINFAPKEKVCRSIVHEILHFQFHKYFWDYLRTKELSEKQIDHIKEAFTFLINEEFIDLFGIKDYGYDLHQKFRQDLAIFWQESKDFLKLLDYSANLIKQKYPKLK